MHRIMLVDDETSVLNALRRTIGECVTDGFDSFRVHVETFEKPEAALLRAQDARFDLVLSDYRMPCMDGVTFLKSLRALQPNAMRLILSGYADLSALVGAINEAQIYRFINKPWQDYELKASIVQALAFQNLLLENQRLADIVRVQRGQLTRQEMALRRLEEESPGITRVNWGPDGSILIDDAE